MEREHTHVNYHSLRTRGQERAVAIFVAMAVVAPSGLHRNINEGFDGYVMPMVGGAERAWESIAWNIGAIGTSPTPSTTCWVWIVLGVDSAGRITTASTGWSDSSADSAIIIDKSVTRYRGRWMATIRSKQGRRYRPSLSSSATQALRSGFGVLSRSLDGLRRDVEQEVGCRVQL
jgi:hypothetical protein